MSIQKKSLISNRIAAKKDNLTKVSSTQVSTAKLGKLPVSLVKPLIRTHVSKVST